MGEIGVGWGFDNGEITMDSVLQKQLNALKEMHEDDFTKSIIKPLFEAMGYMRVDFNGGPYERGKDLIAQINVPPHLY